MKNLKIKNIAVLKKLVASYLIFWSTTSWSQTYSATWNSTTTSSSINGSITFTDITSTFNYLPYNLGGPYTSFDATASGISAFSIDYSGTTYSIAGGQIINIVRRSTGLTFSDLNIFLTSSGTGCAGGTPPVFNGSSANRFTVCSTNEAFVLDLSAFNQVVSSGAINLVPNAYAIRSVYNIQSAALNAGLSYDCNVFDKEGLCLSTGGRYSTTNSPEATTTSGLLIGSYKYDKNVRLGAWVDQNLSTQNADGIKLSNNAPLFGVFGVWAERNDGLGYEVKVSAGYGDKDVTVTRTSTNEGSSKINSRGLQTVSSYGIALDSDWIAAPYVGVKYVSLKRGAYTEGGSSALTYDNLRQESTSVIAGVKFTGKIDPQTFTVLSAGVEQDLNNNVGQYSAGSSNTTAFNSNVQKTRPVVSAGVYYDIDKTQRVGLNATHRQEAFDSTTSTSALATYTVGF